MRASDPEILCSFEMIFGGPMNIEGSLGAEE